MTRFRWPWSRPTAPQTAMPADALTGEFSVYTTIPIHELPYPHGLGKHDYPELERAMERLLGPRLHENQRANEAAFWTTDYQGLIEKYLKPRFDRDGDIVDIARRATNIARENPLLGQRIYGRPDPSQRYWEQLPDIGEEQPRYVKTWVDWPPDFTLYKDGIRRYADGRHRTSYLRSRIQQQDPDFEVLVRIDHASHRS